MPIVTQSNEILLPPNPPNSIEILDMTRLDGRGVTKATCRIRYGPFVFAGYRVVLFPLASRPIVQPPARNTGDGWEPYITILSPTVAEQITSAVLLAYRGAK